LTAYYLDTSVLVSALTREAASPTVQAWLANIDGELVISEWVSTEFASALSLKQRTKQIDAGFRVDARAEFERLKAASFRIIEIERRHLQQATWLIDSPNSALRAGDALHAALAQLESLTLCTRDRTLAENCLMLGIGALLL